MKIKLEDCGKKFNREWIFRGISAEWSPGCSVAILGGNGSGKSTLLQMIAAYLTPSAGRISWELSHGKLEAASVFQHLAWATPAVSLYDDFTLEENLNFFQEFKSLQNGITNDEVVQRLRLEKSTNKPLRQYSSGMRQRVKLGLAIMSDSPLLLLDEPTSHLDATNTQWFRELLTEFKNNRSLFVASNNHSDEIFLAEETIVMDQFK